MDPFTRYRSHPPESRNHRVGVSSHEKAWVDNLRKDRQISGQRHPTNSLCGLSEEKGEKEETEETVQRKGVKWNTMEYLLCFLAFYSVFLLLPRQTPGAKPRARCSTRSRHPWLRHLRKRAPKRSGSQLLTVFDIWKKFCHCAFRLSDHEKLENCFLQAQCVSICISKFMYYIYIYMIYTISLTNLEKDIEIAQEFPFAKKLFHLGRKSVATKIQPPKPPTKHCWVFLHWSHQKRLSILLDTFEKCNGRILTSEKAGTSCLKQDVAGWRTNFCCNCTNCTNCTFANNTTLSIAEWERGKRRT